VITGDGARANKSGLVMYTSNGGASLPFQGGTLCIAPAGLKRGVPITSTGGSGSSACDAVFQIDWNAFASGSLGGNPQSFLHTVGQRINVQWWGRDSTANGSYLSNALQYTVCL
jgi:hypothetical protein